MERLDVKSLSRIIATGTKLIYIKILSEKRIERTVNQAIKLIKGADSLYIWTCTKGFSREGNLIPDTADPSKALEIAINEPEPAVFLFKDLSWFWKDNPFIIRRLKDFAVHASRKAIIITGQDEKVPDPLQEDIFMFYQSLPTMEEITNYLFHLQKNDPFLSAATEQDPELIGKLAVVARGLDLTDIDYGIRTMRVAGDKKGDSILQTLFRTKQKIINASGIMEFVENDVKPDQLGGMENLKYWMERREKAFGIKNISSGKNLPKGILIMGISGCGKSLFVKVLAARWQLPLIRLDMSSVYSGIYGSPESTLNKAFNTVEVVAPCILWIDEIEAGISSQGFKEEGGVASRILGSFLIWMQEKKSPVFVAATANAIEMLPAEVIRKGRFDEIFFVSLPDRKAREEIFRIHLSKLNVEFNDNDISLFAEVTEGYSGAEIEQAVKTAAFEALAENRKIVQHDLMIAFSRTVPLSTTMAEQIKKIEAWAYKRAVPASGKYKK
ncbi:MAG: AAA family ATPase [Nitrospirae bacterium]|jgi:ATP-dependent 26S proteasome regulatory subunit|nr:AAA family ATPase [Nitrospirota bacterium]